MVKLPVVSFLLRTFKIDCPIKRQLDLTDNLVSEKDVEKNIVILLVKSILDANALHNLRTVFMYF